MNKMDRMSLNNSHYIILVHYQHKTVKGWKNPQWGFVGADTDDDSDEYFELVKYEQDAFNFQDIANVMSCMDKIKRDFKIRYGDEYIYRILGFYYQEIKYCDPVSLEIK